MNEPEVLSKEKSVVRKDDTVLRPIEPWSHNIHVFLGHLYGKGLPVPRFLGISGDGREMMEYLSGEFVHPYRWTDEALHEVGRLVSRLHEAASDFTMPDDGLWKPWCLREISSGARVCCHGDIAPWNMLTKDSLPMALIDWEMAGPIDPIIELARVCWLFPQLIDDDLGTLYGLPPAEKRAGQVRIICDAYGLSREQRRGFPDRIIEVVICETAHEAIDTNVAADTEGSLWGFAWRTRSLYWIWRNRAVIQKALD